MEELLQPRRHPKVVSTSSAIAYAAQDYDPPEALNSGLIAGHPWGKRTLVAGGPRTQYMVYDKLGRNVLSCCATPELAAVWANDRLAREAIPPEHYSPRLKNMQFGHRADTNGVFLLHTVLDADGVVVAENTAGRAAAAADAVKALVSRPDCVDATREEFALTVVFAKVTEGRGRKVTPWVYDNLNDDSGMDLVGRELRQLWHAEPLLHSVEFGNHILKGRDDVQSFVTAAHSSLLTYAASLKGSVAQLDIGTENRIIRLVMHSVPISRESALDAMYEHYLDLSQDRGRSTSAPRERSVG